jgi:hypothetical protein
MAPPLPCSTGLALKPLMTKPMTHLLWNLGSLSSLPQLAMSAPNEPEYDPWVIEFSDDLHDFLKKQQEIGIDPAIMADWAKKGIEPPPLLLAPFARAEGAPPITTYQQQDQDPEQLEHDTQVTNSGPATAVLPRDALPLPAAPAAAAAPPSPFISPQEDILQMTGGKAEGQHELGTGTATAARPEPEEGYEQTHAMMEVTPDPALPLPSRAVSETDDGGVTGDNKIAPGPQPESQLQEQAQEQEQEDMPQPARLTCQPSDAVSFVEPDGTVLMDIDAAACAITPSSPRSPVAPIDTHEGAKTSGEAVSLRPESAVINATVNLTSSDIPQTARVTRKRKASAVDPAEAQASAEAQPRRSLRLKTKK